MKEKKTSYYLIVDRIVAKRVYDESYSKDYLFRKGKWVEDTDCEIMDHLMGFDSSEPKDSPYRFGNGSVLAEMKEISMEQAMTFINRQILDILKNKWKDDFTAKKEEWDKKPGWPAKLVQTTFTLNGRDYSISPSDIGLEDDCWDHGFMESIQSDITEDLKAYGATNIYNVGFLD